MRTSNIMKRAMSREEYDDKPTGDAAPVPGAEGGTGAAAPVSAPAAGGDVGNGEDQRPLMPIPEAAEDDSLELDIVIAAGEESIQQGEAEEVMVATEALIGYRYAIESLIANGLCSPATESLIAMGIDNVVGKFHLTHTSLAKESLMEVTDTVERHKLILESIQMEGELWQRFAQNQVLAWKHSMNAVGDFFRSVGGRMAKYREKLAATKREYNSKKNELKGEVNVSQTELWYHFSDDKGPIQTNFAQHLKSDVAMSTYVLVTYPKAVLAEAKQLCAMMKSSNTSTPEGILKFGQAVEKLKSVAELFDPKLIGTTFFSVVKLERNEGKPRRTVTVAGKSLDRLAKLSAFDYVEETGSVAHTAKKVGSHIAAGAIAQVPGGTVVAPLATSAVAGKFSVSAADIGYIIDAGDVYLNNVEAYIKLEGEYKAVCNEAENATDALYKNLDKNNNEGVEVLNQAEKLLSNLLLTGFSQPAKSEMARSIKCAKYNMYLANRAIYNAE